MDTTDKLERRIRSTLLRHDEPIKVRDLQTKTANRAWSSEQFRVVLNNLIREGVVWHENGMLLLIDRSPVLTDHPSSISLLNSSDLGFSRPTP